MSHRCKYCLFSAGLILLGSFPAAAAPLPLTADGVTWQSRDGLSTYYNPDVRISTEGLSAYDKLPQEASSTSPLWTTNVRTGATLTVIDNYLRVNTSASTAALARVRQENGWDLQYDTTVEVRMRVNALSNDALWSGSFLLSSATHLNHITFNQDSIRSYGDSAKAVDLSDWTVLRFTITGAADGGDPLMKVYVNGDLLYTTVGGWSVLADPTTPYFQFGDHTSNTSESGIVDYDYIRWTNTGAFAPIPEASTWAMLLAVGIGAGMIGLCRRRTKVSAGN